MPIVRTVQDGIVVSQNIYCNFHLAFYKKVKTISPIYTNAHAAI